MNLPCRKLYTYTKVTLIAWLYEIFLEENLYDNERFNLQIKNLFKIIFFLFSIFSANRRSQIQNSCLHYEYFRRWSFRKRKNYAGFTRLEQHTYINYRHFFKFRYLRYLFSKLYLSLEKFLIGFSSKPKDYISCYVYSSWMQIEGLHF